ncbi:8-amino-3,8-dideoxy-alpha-D-manno-octulosonate transaminase [subsurface metagenome]
MSGPGAYLIGDEEKKEVMEVLESRYLSRYGKVDDARFQKKVVSFEKKLAEKLGTRYCLAVSSGTGALMAALIALGVGPGVEVIVPGYTFIASISAIIAVGGKPVLAEVDESLTMDPADAEQKITDKTKVILPVHMIGNPADMDRIMEIAKKKNVSVLEDVCQAVGGMYRGRRLGTIGDIGAFSLNVYKVINAGDGGAICTNSRDLYERAFAFHDQGHQPLREGIEIGKRNIIGINLRINELTGAFALGQLKKLDTILSTLKEKKNKLKSAIDAAGIKNMEFRRINDEGECHTLLTVRFATKEIAGSVAQALNTKTMEHSGWHVYNNMEHLLAYRDLDGNEVCRKNSLPQTDDLLSRSVNLSVGVVDPGIGADFGVNILSSDEDIQRVADTFVSTVKPIAEG